MKRFILALPIVIVSFAAPLPTANAQQKSAPIAPATALKDGWDEIDQRLVFLMVRLANTETSLDAVEKALGITTRQEKLSQGDAKRAEQGNERMDRQGGGPVKWSEFYGRTAEKFFYHPVDQSTTYHTATILTQQRSQASAFANVKTNIADAREKMSDAWLRQGIDPTDRQTPEGRFAALAKRLEDIANNLSDSYKVSIDGDRFKDENRKNTFRGLLQESLVNYAEVILALDEMSGALTKQWMTRPNVDKPLAVDVRMIPNPPSQPDAPPVSLDNIESWRLASGSQFQMQQVIRPAPGVAFRSGIVDERVLSKESFDNVDLTLEYRYAAGGQKTKRGGGLVLRASDKFKTDVEVQIADGETGDFYVQEFGHLDSASDRSKTIKYPDGVVVSRRARFDGAQEHAIGEWNSLRVRCDAGQLTVWLNGQEVNRGTNFHRETGPIAIMDQGTEFEYRNIQVVRLPSSTNDQGGASFDAATEPKVALRGNQQAERLLVERSLYRPDGNSSIAYESASGWKLLFDGSSFTGWRNYKRQDISAGWKIENGELICADPRIAGDLITKDLYGSFELSLDYKMSPNSNSGVIFLGTEDEATVWMTGPEVQLFDNNQTGSSEEQLAGWLYRLYRPAIDPQTHKPFDATRPAGEWNTLRISVTPSKCQVTLNGMNYYEFRIGSADWNERVRQSKFANMKKFAKAKSGHIALQGDHGQVSFRNIKIRQL
jgi:hypothetical protein